MNTLVDVCNWCSVEVQLPYGLYDCDRLAAPSRCGAAGGARQYAGIRKDTVHVAGRLSLADGAGPFGNPTSDSARTMVTPGDRAGAGRGLRAARGDGAGGGPARWM